MHTNERMYKAYFNRIIDIRLISLDKLKNVALINIKFNIIIEGRETMIYLIV